MTYPTRWQVPAGYSATNDADVFPALPGQKFIDDKTPKFPPTIIKRAVSGRQVNLQMASQPTWEFKISYDWLSNNLPTTSDLQALQAFFLSRLGQGQPFFFFDPGDNTVTGQQIGTGDGATKTFQLCRAVSSGFANAFIENIYAVLGTPTVAVNGVGTSAFTIGPFGTITFTTAPASGAPIFWSGQFFFLCHFAQDSLSAAQMVKTLWNNKGIAFSSFKP